MAGEEVGSLAVRVGLDMVEFNKGIASLSKQMQIVGQDFKNASGGLDKVGDASKISALKIAELTSKIDLQKKIVEEFRQAHAKAAEQFGEGSKKALDYELKLKRAEGTLQSMERELKTTNEGLKDQGVDAKKASTEISNLDDKTSKLHSSMKTLGAGLKLAAIGIAAAGTAFVGLAAASVKDASEAEASVAQLDAVIKSTGGAAGVTRDELTSMADALEKTTMFSAESTQAADALLLTFTNIGKDIFPQTTKIALDMAQALGTDASGGAIQLGKALNDPIAGISALSRVGVSFSEDQKAVIKKLQETGDMAGAQKIILAELNKEFGGSAEAAGKTFAGQLEIAKNALGNVKETIGTALLPKLTELLNWVSPNLPAIADFFTKAFDSIGIFITNNLIPAFTSFLDWIRPNIPAIKEIVSVAFDTIKAIFKGVSDFVTTYVLPIFVGLKDWFVENWPKIKDAVMLAYDYIKPHFDKLVDTIKADVMPIIMGLLGTVKLAMPGIQSIFEIVFPAVVYVIGLAMDAIGILIEVVRGIYDFIKPGLDLVANLFSTVFGGIQKVIEGVQRVLDKFNGTPTEDKKTTVTTSYISDYDNYGQPIYTKNTPGAHHITGYDDYGQPIYEKNATGTNNWRGGLTRVNEKGGEIMNLPRGTQIIPHDISMAMANNNSGGGVLVTGNTFVIREEADIGKVSRELFRLQQGRSRSLGVAT